MEIKEYKRRWLKYFAAGISKREIQDCVVNNGDLIWHVFSWELLPEDAYLEGDAARRAYDGINKDGAIYIEETGGRRSSTKPLPEHLQCASALDEFAEVYVSAADFSWTYIKTHERMCGPYFCKRA